MDNSYLFYGHLEYFMDSWEILLTFDKKSGNPDPRKKSIYFGQSKNPRKKRLNTNKQLPANISKTFNQ
jgi:hypothetical protein